MTTLSKGQGRCRRTRSGIVDLLLFFLFIVGNVRATRLRLLFLLNVEIKEFPQFDLVLSGPEKRSGLSFCEFQATVLLRSSSSGRRSRRVIVVVVVICVVPKKRKGVVR